MDDDVRFVFAVQVTGMILFLALIAAVVYFGVLP